MATFENEKTRTVLIFRTIEFMKTIRIVTESEIYYVTDAAWGDIVSRWQDREGPGVRVFEIDDNVLIVTVDTEKEEMLMK